LKRHLPNAVTLLRFALLPLFVLLFLDERLAAAAAALAASAFTDWLDGFLARRWKVASRFGALLDPIADKLVQAAAVALLAWRGAVPPWFLGLVLGRELFLLYGAVRIRRRRGRLSVQARLEGKVSTLLVYLVCCAALVDAPRGLVDAGVLVAAFFVIASSVRYTLEGRRQYAG
jgi:cardiolipin synthase